MKAPIDPPRPRASPNARVVWNGATRDPQPNLDSLHALADFIDRFDPDRADDLRDRADALHDNQEERSGRG